MTSDNQRVLIQALPKVDLHRHLEGSIRLSTLVEVARKHHIPLPSYDVETLRPYVQMMPGDPRTLDRFLGKFDLLRTFYRSPDIVRRITREVVEDAAADHVRYLELRFTPYALASRMHFPMIDTVGWVADAARAAAAEFGIQVGLIVSINRHEPLEVALEAMQAALSHRERGVLGLDLAGREVGFPARPFGPVFLSAKREGLGITIHAGEWHGPDNIRDAIENLYTDRIGHGVRVVEDSWTVGLARERGTIFEVCPTSNVQTGVVRELALHPLLDLSYLNLGYTINTDDPAISNIELSDEYLLVMQSFGFTLGMLRQAILRAASASFLPAADKAALVESLRTELDSLGVFEDGVQTAESGSR